MPRMRFEPAPKHVPKLSLAFVRRIVRYFAPYPTRFFAVIFLILASAALGLVPPLLYKKSSTKPCHTKICPCWLDWWDYPLVPRFY